MEKISPQKIPLRNQKQLPITSVDELWQFRNSSNLECSTRIIYEAIEKGMLDLLQKGMIDANNGLFSWIFFVLNFLIPTGPKSNDKSTKLMKHLPPKPIKMHFLKALKVVLPRNSYPEYIQKSQTEDLFEEYIWRFWQTLVLEDSLLRVSAAEKYDETRNQLSLFVNKNCTASQLASTLWGEIVTFRQPFDSVPLKEVSSKGRYCIWNDERKDLNETILIGPLSLLNYDEESLLLSTDSGKTVSFKKSHENNLLSTGQELFVKYGESADLEICECEKCKESPKEEKNEENVEKEVEAPQTIDVQKKKRKARSASTPMVKKSSGSPSQKRYRRRTSASFSKNARDFIIDSLLSMQITDRDTATDVSTSLYNLKLQEEDIEDAYPQYTVESIVSQYFVSYASRIKGWGKSEPTEQMEENAEMTTKRKLRERKRIIKEDDLELDKKVQEAIMLASQESENEIEEKQEEVQVIQQEKEFQDEKKEGTEEKQQEPKSSEGESPTIQSEEEKVQQIDLEPEISSTLSKYKKMIKTLQSKLKMEKKWSKQVQNNLLSEQVRREQVEKKYQQLKKEFEEYKKRNL